jgi:arylsulfatase A-like enzyme
VLTAVVGLSLVAARDAHSQDSIRPNIVLIVSDYMGYSDIGPYGATDIRTPSLDAIAEQGVRFSSYYAASPVCGPSRAALLSGRYPARLRFETNVPPDAGGLSAENDTLVRELSSAGYRTGMFGKWHLGRREGFSPRSHGLDTFYGFYDWTIGYHTHLNSAGEPGLYRDDELVTEDGYLTELLSTEATRFIEDNADGPFFVYLAYNVGLPPFQGPDLPEAQWSSGWNVNDATRNDYVEMVEAMDDGIGRVLSKLDELDLTNDTLVVFTYDHGGQDLSRSDPLFHGFGTLWEGGIRVPLLMRWPAKFERGSEVDRPSIAMDVTATILDAAARNPDSLQLDGTSLLPLLAGGADVPAATLFWRFRTPLGWRVCTGSPITRSNSPTFSNTKIAQAKTVDPRG